MALKGYASAQYNIGIMYDKAGSRFKPRLSVNQQNTMPTKKPNTFVSGRLFHRFINSLLMADHSTTICFALDESKYVYGVRFE